MAPLNPNIRFTLLLEKVPASLGTNTYRWALRPLPDAGAWTEGRVTGYGKVKRGSSSVDGDYDIGSSDLTISDDDGLIRGLLASASTRYFTGREGALEILSEAGRAAGTAWRPLMRGRVSDIQCPPGRQATLRLSDIVGSQFTGFDLEKTLGVPMTRAIIPNLPDKTLNRIFPIITGEWSDIGTVDENGDAADKGLLPVIDAGPAFLFDDGSSAPDGTVAQKLTPPNLTAPTVNGTPGTTAYDYLVTALSEVGETYRTGVANVTTGPEVLNATDSITLNWGNITGNTGYRVYRDFELIATLAADTITYTDIGAPARSINPPDVNTAEVTQTVDGETVTGWRMFVLKIGAASEIFHIYASDLAEHETPRRVRVPEGAYGSEFLVYGRTGYPHSDPFVEVAGVRFAVIYGRGPRVQQHLNGTVTIAWNGCGDDDVGDGSGTTITEAFPALQHVVNEYGIKNNGEGYLTGDWGPLETYSNGVSKLKTSAFASAQAKTVEWIGSRGYQCSIAIFEPISLREFLRNFHITFACHTTSDHHGQFYPFLIDDTASVSAGRIYRDRIEITKLTDQQIEHDKVETKVIGHYDWDPDAQTFRIADQVFEDTDASDAYFAPRTRSPRKCFYTRDAATFTDACTRHLTRYKVAPRYLSWETDLTGLEDENGDQVRATHYDGAGGTDGDAATPFVIMDHEIDPKRGRVVLTGFDLNRILSAGFPVLATDASGAVLGDETSSSAPTTGAYELR